MSFVKNLFSSPSAPSAPNPGAITAAQGAANADAARLNAKINRADTYTPFGSVNYDDMGDDRWQVTQTLSPEMQGLHDQQMDIGKGVQGAAQRAVGQLPQDQFNLNGIQDFQSGISYDGLTANPSQQGLDDYAKSGTDSYMAEWGRMNDPYYQDQQTALETKLVNQGITQGSDAYTRAMSDYGRQVDSARTGATNAAIAQGSGLRSSLLADSLTGRQQGIGERMADVNMANAGRAQSIQDRLLERSQPMNELAALLQGSPAVQTPQQQGMAPVGVQAPDVGGAQALAYQAQQNAYNQQMGQQNAAFGGLASMGGGYLAGR